MNSVIHRSAQIACSPERAYQHFTQNPLLESFFTVKAEVEPKVGGKYELDWDPSTTPEQATIGCRITALAEMRLLAFDWKGPPPYAEVMNGADPLTHVVISFFPGNSPDEGKCHVHIVHSGWGSGEQWQQAREYFDRAWGMVLKSLASKIAEEARQAT